MINSNKIIKSVMFRLVPIIFTIVPALVSAQRNEAEKVISMPEYITMFKEVAKAEMRRFGIPASITLAQGILESNYGNSKLAKKANNHFGIKCGSNWQGHTFIQDDDEEKECFRKYESALHSFDDHSKFLKGKERYAFLFKLDRKDYKGWARGLQQAGYATNPNYGALLIRLIEERNLDHFDTEDAPLTEADAEYLKSMDNQFYEFNGIKTVISQPNELPSDIAAKYDISLKTLLNNNDMIEGEYIPAGSRIYLEPKRKTGYEDYHKVEKNETMHSISQRQGIKLKMLLKKNMMTYGQEPAVGEILCLKKKCDHPPKLITDEEIKEDIKQKIQKRVDETVEEQKKEAPATKIIETEIKEQKNSDTETGIIKVEEKKETVINDPLESTDNEEEFIDWEKDPEVKKEQVKAEEKKETSKPEEPTSSIPIVKYHTVAPQETLFRVAANNNVSVNEIKVWNKLNSNELYVGQLLIVGFIAESEPMKREEVKKENVFPKKTTPAKITSEKTPRYYTVALKETLYRIAVNNKISVDDLKKWNGLKSNDLLIGQRLIVGYTNTEVVQEKIEEPEPEIDETAPPVEEPQDPKGASMPTYHRVQQGETLYSIAQKYNISPETLVELNNLPSNNIVPGQVLKLK